MTAFPETRLSISERNCRHCCAGSITKDGIRAPTWRRRVEAPSFERIHDSVHRDPGIDVEEAARVVFAALAARLPASELEDAKAATPEAAA